MFIFKNLNIEAKRRHSSLICEASEGSEANWFILKIDNIEAKRTGSIMILYLKKRKKANFRFFFKRRAKNERVR